MRQSTRVGLALIVLGMTLPAANAQETRLNLFDPSVVLFTGGRGAACDALSFTPDGKQLLAVGDDKCVHVWNVRDRDLDYTEPAWWNSFRERRGSIFTLAITADSQKIVAGGFGRLTSEVVVFDLPSRKIIHALSPAIQPAYRATSTVWSSAFDKAGNQVLVGHGDGSVWLWNLTEPAENAVQQVGTAVADDNGDFTLEARVIWVGFDDDGQPMFARRNGEVYRQNDDGKLEKLFQFSGPVSQGLRTGDGRHLVARSSGQRILELADGTKTVASFVEVRKLPTGELAGTINFDAQEFPDGMGLDLQHNRIGIGVKLLDTPGGESLFREAAGYMRIFQLDEDGKPSFLSEATFGTKPDDRVKSFPEAIAFHPDGKRIAVAAGWDHETSLWKLEDDKLELLQVTSGVGQSLWEVRANDDGTRISFRSQAITNPTHPNHRGQGPWRTFDLKDRTWIRAEEPEQNRALDSMNGWSVQFDPLDQYRWVVKLDGGPSYELPLDKLRDFTPICYTFLPAEKGAKTVRLAVGHYWGYSLFELKQDGPPRRIRRGIGHHGYVSSIVPANDGKWLITASRDQTICLWSSEPWQNQPELGAKFEMEEAELYNVTAVDAGSPAWEMGLIAGDKIRKVYQAGKAADPFDWPDLLSQPTPGEELALEIWRFPDQKVPIRRKTSLLQRPVWRFLPTTTSDWVLYRYQDYTYDCSTNGDSYIGWLLGGPSAADTPQFCAAERFREQFRRPAEVRDFLTRYAREPAPFFRELLPPPTVSVEASERVVANDRVRIKITVQPATNARREAVPVDKVELWLGDASNLDFRLREWPGGNSELTFEAEIDASELRFGTNQLVAVAHSRARGEAATTVELPRQEVKRGVLRGLIVGVNSYQQIGFQNLSASVNDSKLMQATLQEIGSKPPFEKAEVQLLVEEKATKSNILKALDELADQAGPNDWLVLFFAGHGFALRGDPPEIDGFGEVVPGSWFFVSYAKEDQQPHRLSAEELFGKLAKVPCRKLILLDSCHSGAAVGADGGRDLRRDDKGPIVLTGASPDEQAGESIVELLINGETTRRNQGFFTTAIYSALGPYADKADSNRDGLLTVDELFQFSRQEVFRLRPDQGQTVTMSPFPLRNIGLVEVQAPE